MADGVLDALRALEEAYKIHGSEPRPLHALPVHRNVLGHPGQGSFPSSTLGCPAALCLKAGLPAVTGKDSSWPFGKPLP